MVGAPLNQVEELSRVPAQAASRILPGEPAGRIILPPQGPGRPAIHHQLLSELLSVVQLYRALGGGWTQPQVRNAAAQAE